MALVPCLLSMLTILSEVHKNRFQKKLIYFFWMKASLTFFSFTKIPLLCYQGIHVKCSIVENWQKTDKKKIVFMRLFTIKVSLYLDPIISTRSIIIHIIFCALGRVAINCPEALPKNGKCFSYSNRISKE